MNWCSKAMVFRLISALCATTVYPVRAADHRDGSALVSSPDTDINDVYAWVSPDRQNVHLIMTVFPMAGLAARFSDAAYYVFHITSRDQYENPMSAPVRHEIICKFDSLQNIECWGVGDYVSGKPDSPAGLLSKRGRMKVFAGLRKDPFFFNLDGFNAFRQSIKTVLTSNEVTFDSEGCPTPLPMGGALASKLREKPDLPGSLPTDSFANLNTLALILSVETSAISQGAPIVGVWAATHRIP